MPGPIVLLVLARAFVLADDVVLVLIDRETRGHAGLLVAPHAQPIDVDARAGFLDQRRGRSQSRELAPGGLVDGIGVRVLVGRELDLGARDAQETQWLIGGERTSLSGAHDVVRDRGDRRGLAGRGPEGAERM